MMRKPDKYFLNSVLDGYLKKTDVFVFDLNGLIIDDEALQLVAHNAGIAAYYKTNRPKETPPQISEEQWGRICVGRHPQDWLPIIVGRCLDEGEKEAVKKVKDDVFFKLIGDRIHEIARPGAIPLIQHLHESGRPLALATSSAAPFVKKALGEEGLNVLSCFDYWLCGDMVKKKKPDPEIYDTVRAHFGAGLRYLVFEDAESGCLSAYGAKMDCIAVPNKFTLTQDLSKAVVVIDSLCPDAVSIRDILPAALAKNFQIKANPAPQL